jgi:hypothetical protein
MSQRIFAIFITAVLLLTGCSSSTGTASPTASPQPTRPSAYQIDTPTDPLLPGQLEYLNSGISTAQHERTGAWLNYWIQCDNPPFDPAGKMTLLLIWDDPQNPTEDFLVIESGGAFYASPVSDGQWIDPPASACQGTLDPRYAPLLLANGEDRQWLRVEGGSIVQRNAQGEQVAILYRAFEFDAEKLSHMPASYEYLRDHPEEFVQAPDPWVNGVGAFNTWIDDYLDKALGDLSVRVPNVMADICWNDSKRVYLPAETDKAELPIGSIDFFYFTHHGVIYPVYLLIAQKSGKVENTCTMGVVLIDFKGMSVQAQMQDIYRRDLRFQYAAIWHAPEKSFSDDVNTLIFDGFGKIDPLAAPRLTKIGFGVINFLDAP